MSIRLLAAACLVIAASACTTTAGSANEPQATSPMPPLRANAALAAAVAGDWRDAGNRARDGYRHPAETLTFFAVKPTDRVIEITPGSGWYSEILAPYLKGAGRYTAAYIDPMSVEAGRARDSYARYRASFDTLVQRAPQPLERAQVLLFDAKAPVLGTAGSADAVLTFRNVHNWVAAGAADAYFKAFFDVLTPGGTLGVVDHRAKPGTDLATMKKSGYLTEAMVIALAQQAGFQLVASSEVNANPLDTADHPNGVWTLPPTNRHDAVDADKYKAIGESDRMTLRFRKPR